MDPIEFSTNLCGDALGYSVFHSPSGSPTLARRASEGIPRGTAKNGRDHRVAGVDSPLPKTLPPPLRWIASFVVIGGVVLAHGTVTL